VDPEKEGRENHVLKSWFLSLEGRRHFLKLGSRSLRKKYIDFMDNKKLKDVLKSFGRKNHGYGSRSGFRINHGSHLRKG
jgi:hypothetical protein